MIRFHYVYCIALFFQLQHDWTKLLSFQCLRFFFLFLLQFSLYLSHPLCSSSFFFFISLFQCFEFNENEVIVVFLDIENCALNRYCIVCRWVFYGTYGDVFRRAKHFPFTSIHDIILSSLVSRQCHKNRIKKFNIKWYNSPMWRRQCNLYYGCRGKSTWSQSANGKYILIFSIFFLAFTQIVGSIAYYCLFATFSIVFNLIEWNKQKQRDE